jgi:uncharacterized protein (TIGR02246 family)
MPEVTEIIDAQVEAYRDRDVERFLSYYADDVSVVLFDGTPQFPDKAAMREAYGKLFANSPDLRVTIANRIAAGDFVVDEEHISGFHFPGMPTELRSAVVYRVTDGKIAGVMLLS